MYANGTEISEIERNSIITIDLSIRDTTSGPKNSIPHTSILQFQYIESSKRGQPLYKGQTAKCILLMGSLSLVRKFHCSSVVPY